MEKRLKEKVNKEMLERLIRVKSPLLGQEEYDKLLKIRKYKGESYMVKYRKSEYGEKTSGRYFATSKGSLQYMWGVTRGMLCKGIYVDVDMVNSNYKILESVAKMNGIEHEILRTYNISREGTLREMGKTMGRTRKEMKELLSSIICGGSVNTWMRKYKVMRVPELVNTIVNEINRIGKEIMKLDKNEKYLDIAVESKRKKGEEMYNVKGTALSFLLQDIESEILMCMVERAKAKHKLKAGVLMHDGCLFYYDKSDKIPDEILRDLENNVYDKLGYRIELLCKPHETDERLLDISHMKDERVEKYYINNGNPEYDEEYTEDKMREYPMDKPIVCIKANMGVGKTVELERMIGKMDRDKRVLIVSYVQTLCDTYYSKFERYGFKLYKNMSYEEFESEGRIIICLDSIYKLSLENDTFDYVIVDECLSVMEHFQSSVMREVSQNMDTLESCLMRSDHIYYIDANVDSGMMMNNVEWLEKKKKAKSYWIYNRYVRETNRRAYIMNEMDKETKITHIINLLRGGKRVVCPCSSKTMVDTIYETVTSLLPNLKAKRYTSESSRSELYKDSLNTNEAWSELDLLIYSPTISAGVSFEKLHFHALVACFESSMLFASANTCTQQLFRVRQLIDGDMYIYINTTSYTLPVTEKEIDNQLQRDVRTIGSVLEGCNRFLELDTTTYKRGFNKRKLSYQIIKNIVLAKNQSLMHFTSIMKNTMRANGIEYETKIDPVISSKIELKKPTEEVDIREECMNTFKESPKELVLCNNEMVEVEKAMRNGRVDISKETRVKRNITINLRNWNSKIERISEGFFERNVLSVNDAEQKRINQMVTCAYRYKRMDGPLSEAYKLLHNQFDGGEGAGDNNFRMFRNMSKTGHQRTIAAKRMLMGVFGAEDGRYKESILNKKFKDKEWKPGLIRYLRSMDEGEYSSLLSLFQLWDRNSNKSKTTSYKKIDNFELDKSRLPSGFVRTIMKKTFHIDFILSSCKNYMIFDNTFWDNICENNETFLTKTSRFIDDDRLIDFLDENI